MDYSKVKHITADSRQVRKGSIFFAIKGNTSNGENYIETAFANGAEQVVVFNQYNNPAFEDRLIKVQNVRKELAKAAAEVFTKQPQNIVAVTGTNGKTSTVSFYRQICEFNEIKAASIGTLGVVTKNLELDFCNHDSLTSFDPVALHTILEKLTDSGVTNVALEASSHGLDQYRLDGAKIMASGFTNLSRDHLDYHANMHEYFVAKARLFSDLTRETAVLNADAPEFNALEGICYRSKLKVFTYGEKGKNLKLKEYRDKTLFLELEGKSFEIKFNLYGGFQIYNTLCAMGLALASGIGVDKVLNAVPHLVTVSGRLEEVAEYKGAKIFVDYAHKPNALENILKSLREICRGRLIVVFGCGGDRDIGKRPMMGKIVSDFADIGIVTDDNPRTEDPAAIRSQIMQTCTNGIEIAGRGTAIAEAVNMLKSGDILVIAGKGHEDYQVIGKEKKYFCDKDEVLKNCK